MALNSRILVWSIGGLVLLLLTVASWSQGLPYFPERGQGAIQQRALELNNPAVVFCIALQPGYEDLSLIAHVRMGLGARGIVAYVTNGDATPGDAGGNAPLYIAAQRKEEAYQATRYLGGTAYFLNVPDPGIVPARRSLEQIWQVDTVISRIEHALRFYRPDVVIVGGDRRGEERQSDRQQLLVELVLKAAKVAADPTARPDTVKPGAWKVPRVYVEGERPETTVRSPYDEVHPVWKKSYRSIANEAAHLYQSLKLQIGAWIQKGDPSYTMVYPGDAATPASLLKGLPTLGPLTRGFRATIDGLLRRRARTIYAPSLTEVSRAIDSLDLMLARNRRTVQPDDLRILASWKNSLEGLRCSLLNLRMEYAISDTFVTKSQLVYLRFSRVTPFSDSSRTRIFFPGAVDHTWGIDVSPENQFGLQPPREFKIITPWAMDFTVPVSQFGMTQSLLRTRFSFIVIHHDAVREKEYVYRGEIPLRAGPRRTLEVLTPVVRALDGEPVVVRMMNISRDAYKGTLGLSDTLTQPVSHEVFLLRKDFVLVDTLPLFLRAPLAAGTYPIKLALSGGIEVAFTARSFEAHIDSGARVGLLSKLEDGPVEQALRRLRISWQMVDRSFSKREDLARYNVLIVDRDALVGNGIPVPIWNATLDWVRKGGQLVVFPQTSAPGERSLLSGASFRTGPMLDPEAPVRVDSTDPLSARPNIIAAADWGQWVVARSLCSVVVDPGRAAHLVVTSEHDAPLVVVLPEGKGRMTLIAIDLTSQLMNVHPGSFRILANLLSVPHAGL